MVEEKSKCWEIIQACFNTINHVLIGSISLYMIWFCWTLGNSLITQHVLLCTIGYQFLMAEAIMTLYSENSWTKMTTRKTKTLMHIFLQVVGSLMAITGISIEINSKPVAGETHQEHFSTTHGILGLISFIFLILTCLNGIAAFLAPQMKFYVKPVYNKMCHNLTAMIAFVVGMASLIFGFKSEFFEYFADPLVVKWIKIFTVVTILLTSIGPLKTCYGQIKGLFRK